MTNDSGQASPDTYRPWTAGPWSAYGGSVWAGPDPEVEGHPLFHVHRSRGGVGVTDWLEGQPVATNVRDTELIALAPDMAEAILAWRDEMVAHAVMAGITLRATEKEQAVLDVADKLRTIAGSHE